MVSFRRYCLVAFGALCLVLSGCKTGSPPAGVQFRSDEYLFYRMGNNDTLASLSERFWGEPGKAWLIREVNGNTDFRPGDLVIVPLKQTRPGGLYEDGFQGVPILCYHKFGKGKASGMNMPASVFDQQMRYLKDNNYHVISPDDLLGFLDFSQQIPRRSVIISIDDGYRSVRDVAWPILKRYGFVATLFVYTDYIGISSKALSWDDLREMKAAGFTVGSHSVAHSDLTRPGINETGEQFLGRVKHELATSKKIIDRELDQDTIFFSFPFGRSNAGTIALAKAAGYRMAVTVERGTNPFFSNPLDLRRDMILKRDMQSFVSRLITFNSVSLR